MTEPTLEQLVAALPQTDGQEIHVVAIAGQPVDGPYDEIQHAIEAAAQIPDGHVMTLFAANNGNLIDPETGTVVGTWEA